MAETFIPPPAAPLVAGETLPNPFAKRDGRQTVSNEQAQLVSAPQPIVNGEAATIFREPHPEKANEPVSIGNRDVNIAASFQPVSNEVGAGTIYGDGPRQPRVNLPPPPNPISTNLEVKFVPAPQPIQNNAEKSIMYGPLSSLIPIPDGEPRPPESNKNTVRNESMQFTHAPGPLYTSDTFIPPPPTAATLQTPPRSDVMNVGGGDVQILPGHSQTMNVIGDVSFGGGGDPTKAPRSEEISYSGKSAFAVGSGEVYTTPSGDTTREANSEDRTFAKSGETIGNHEAITGAKGEPTANLDHFDPAMGAQGAPKNIRG